MTVDSRHMDLGGTRDDFRDGAGYVTNRMELQILKRRITNFEPYRSAMRGSVVFRLAYFVRSFLVTILTTISMTAVVGIDPVMLGANAAFFAVFDLLFTRQFLRDYQDDGFVDSIITLQREFKLIVPGHVYVTVAAYCIWLFFFILFNDVTAKMWVCCAVVGDILLVNSHIHFQLPAAKTNESTRNRYLDLRPDYYVRSWLPIGLRVLSAVFALSFVCWVSLHSYIFSSKDTFEVVEFGLLSMLLAIIAFQMYFCVVTRVLLNERIERMQHGQS